MLVARYKKFNILQNILWIKLYITFISHHILLYLKCETIGLWTQNTSDALKLSSENVCIVL